MPDDDDVPGPTLNALADTNRLDDMWRRLKSLPKAQAIRELVDQDSHGSTALHCALFFDAQLELIKDMCSHMKDDVRRRNLMSIKNTYSAYPLHYCAWHTTRLDVLSYVIDMYPHAMMTKDMSDCSPLHYIRNSNTSRANHSQLLQHIEERMDTLPFVPNQIAVKCAATRLKREGWTAAVSSRSINDLPPPLFVFKVLDDLFFHSMWPAAEDLVAYVGVDVGLPTDEEVREENERRSKAGRRPMLLMGKEMEAGGVEGGGDGGGGTTPPLALAESVPADANLPASSSYKSWVSYKPPHLVDGRLLYAMEEKYGPHEHRSAKVRDHLFFQMLFPLGNGGY